MPARDAWCNRGGTTDFVLLVGRQVGINPPGAFRPPRITKVTGRKNYGIPVRLLADPNRGAQYRQLTVLVEAAAALDERAEQARSAREAAILRHKADQRWSRAEELRRELLRA